MDADLFDALTRSLVTRRARRGLLGGVAAALGLDAFLPVTSAAKNRKHKRKHKHKKKHRRECGGGMQCPVERPCCFNGQCQTLCGTSCCDDCFVEILLATGQPDVDHPLCCLASGGSICSPGVKPRKKKKNSKKKKSKRQRQKRRNDPADDVCCYPNETCVNGACCCDGCQGSLVCGGTCCPIAGCCNGRCCENGTVCATTPAGKACVSASRGCSGDGDCFSGEVCHGGVCCSGGRVCTDGEGGDVCCAAGARCEQPNNTCCPINTVCQTYKARRVRR
jgi:hypothetical protein